MGKLIYGTDAGIDIEDRVLAHLQVVILSKMRRSESFAFSWEYGREAGSGRTTIWVHPSMNLRFRYNGSRAPELNRAWLEELSVLANSANGLRLIPEPEVAPTSAERGLRKKFATAI
ncbi:ATP-dependent DNA ligase [Naasia sp. SYSU D00057]|uniref:DUF7882 family protein n=1 Tax=Naasia sp. SYSU D00057 TaxID=2817380 RepID=UPI001B30F378|nr:ATP-dependent DNA ligase [Naasia sp. SYSU D00057]